MSPRSVFMFVCIPVRLLMAYAVKKMNNNMLVYAGYIGAIISLSFFYLYFTNGRKFGIETNNKPIWWTNIRIFHGILYGMFAIAAINKLPYSYMFLFADAIFGLLMSIRHYSIV